MEEGWGGGRGGGREGLVISSKLQPWDFSRGAAAAATAKSLATLGLDQLDLVLLHGLGCDPEETPRCATAPGWRDGWDALGYLQQMGSVRHIGVSNFEAGELSALLETGSLPPAVVQNRMDPFHQDLPVRQLCAKHGIVYQAHSLLGTAWTDDLEDEDEGCRDGSHSRSDCAGSDAQQNPVLSDSRLIAIAMAHGRSVPQVLLRWAAQEQVATIPRCVCVLARERLCP